MLMIKLTNLFRYYFGILQGNRNFGSTITGQFQKQELYYDLEIWEHFHVLVFFHHCVWCLYVIILNRALFVLMITLAGRLHHKKSRFQHYKEESDIKLTQSNNIIVNCVFDEQIKLCLKQMNNKNLAIFKTQNMRK